MRDMQTTTRPAPDFIPTERLIRRPQVLQKIGMSRDWLYRAVRDGRFPQPRQIGENSVAWLESEVDGWIHSRPVADAAEAA